MLMFPFTGGEPLLRVEGLLCEEEGLECGEECTESLLLAPQDRRFFVRVPKGGGGGLGGGCRRCVGLEPTFACLPSVDASSDPGGNREGGVMGRVSDFPGNEGLLMFLGGRAINFFGKTLGVTAENVGLIVWTLVSSTASAEVLLEPVYGSGLLGGGLLRLSFARCTAALAEVNSLANSVPLAGDKQESGMTEIVLLLANILCRERYIVYVTATCRDFSICCVHGFHWQVHMHMHMI